MQPDESTQLPVETAPQKQQATTLTAAQGSHEAIAAHFNMATDAVIDTLSKWRPTPGLHQASLPLAKKLTEAAHKASQSKYVPSMEALLNQFPLSEAEGLALMCLAESLIRIPDKETRVALLHDQLTRSHWVKSMDMQNAIWLNTMVFGVAATTAILNVTQSDLQKGASRLVAKYGEGFIDKVVGAIIQQMAFQFVMGETLVQAWSKVNKINLYSFDMLGEAALTNEDADNYFIRYKEAADILATQQDSIQEPTLSIKLSALHPRYEFHQEEAVFNELFNTAHQLIDHAVTNGVPVTIDAEETDRLEISLKLFEKIRFACAKEHRSKIGLAIQAYQKRAIPVIERLEQHALQSGAQIPIRLVKGAYWDQEIKWSQQLGWSEFPVFTDKDLTDISYAACAKKLLSNKEAFYPQFATHNPITIASIVQESGCDFTTFEFQRLFGMGEATYKALAEDHPEAKCRVYAPVGEFKQLLPYLVRRMIENGANTSFVNQLGREALDLDRLLLDPWESLTKPLETAVTKPLDLYGNDRRNASGINLSGTEDFNTLLGSMSQFHQRQWEAQPTSAVLQLESTTAEGNTDSTTDADGVVQYQNIYNPANLSDQVGIVRYATPNEIELALKTANEFELQWRYTPAEERANAINLTAELFEKHRAELYTLLIREAGKTYSNAQNELREAVDFLRYYANEAVRLSQPIECPGPSGEMNTLRREGLGTIACISPWNFPLAIFTGQVAAAVVAGNPVIAKPAIETPLVGARIIELMHEAGIPKAALQYLPAQNKDCDQYLWNDSRIRGVAFTGSTATAKHIHRQLANVEGAIPRLIAETGGLNAMIIDSSALLDQAVADLVESAFDSAGQRCSAARVAYVQDDIYDSFAHLLKGNMATLNVGDPLDPKIDVGPIISETAKRNLEAYLDEAKARVEKSDHRLFQSANNVFEESDATTGYFIPPTVIEIDHIKDIGVERFGPILHLIRYKRESLQDVINEINATGYGLTFGIHTRLDQRAQEVSEQIQAGNIYINRNIIGAVVETQPFGGRGLSGTGPKAGGPDYLVAFMSSKTISDNISAKGGDPALYNLERER